MKYSLPVFFLLSNLNFSLTPQLSATHDVHIGLDQNIPLYKNLDPIHHPVSTPNLEAQRYFDQGFTFLYAFNHDAAYASFRQAAQLDPQLAMAYWGMAMALGSNINSPVTSERQQKAYGHAQQALQLLSQANKNEQAYIEAMAKRYSNQPHPNFQQLNIDYKNAMKKVVDQYPDDLDAATLYAESLLDINPWNQWTLEGKPNEGTLEAVDTLESVIKRDPMHLGANHFYIHAVEASKHPERALLSADRLTQLTPIAGHIQHMPSHIYMLVGDYEKAAAVNVKAVKDDFNYIQQFGAKGYPTHYLSHNLAMLSRAYALSGQLEKSIQAANELYQFYLKYYPETKQLEVYAPTYLFVLMHFQQWQQILRSPPPPVDLKLTTIIWHFSQAVALAATGQIEKAKAEQQLFQEGWKNLPADLPYGNNTASAILAIADDYLNAQLASHQQHLAEAIDFLRQGVAAEDALNYDEPTNWPFSLRESLGGALLKAKEYAQAEVVFRQDLEKHPGSGRALYGLLLALQAQQREVDAYWIKQRLTRAWRSSDTCLTAEILW
jgi:tetratricopeptide (TPR) repeat protein